MTSGRSRALDQGPQPLDIGRPPARSRPARREGVGDGGRRRSACPPAARSRPDPAGPAWRRGRRARPAPGMRAASSISTTHFAMVPKNALVVELLERLALAHAACRPGRRTGSSASNPASRCGRRGWRNAGQPLDPLRDELIDEDAAAHGTRPTGCGRWRRVAVQALPRASARPATLQGGNRLLRGHEPLQIEGISIRPLTRIASATRANVNSQIAGRAMDQLPRG